MDESYKIYFSWIKINVYAVFSLGFFFVQSASDFLYFLVDVTLMARQQLFALKIIFESEICIPHFYISDIFWDAYGVDTVSPAHAYQGLFFYLVGLPKP